MVFKLLFFRILFLFLPVFFVALSSQANAEDSPACYAAKEAEAEQGIRIHSELMVIGLGCQHMVDANGKNLYLAYREFTKRHEKLFAAYERILMEYFEAQGDNKTQAEAELNRLRTEFANKIANDQARMRPDLFCNRYAPRIQKSVDFDHQQMREWAATIFPSHPASRPLCEGQLEHSN